MEQGDQEAWANARNAAFLDKRILSIILAHLDPRSLIRLRAVGRFFFLSITQDVVMARVRLPMTTKWTRDKIWSDLMWFIALPPFDEPECDFPFFRFRGAEARLVQGALRAFRTESTATGRELVASIQPSVSWSSTYDVRFLISSARLVFQGCKCRNGYVYLLFGVSCLTLAHRKAPGCVHYLLVRLGIEHIQQGIVNVVM
jgi:hypothetical protein